jgi:hypothetical protein
MQMAALVEKRMCWTDLCPDTPWGIEITNCWGSTCKRASIRLARTSSNPNVIQNSRTLMVAHTMVLYAPAMFSSYHIVT